MSDESVHDLAAAYALDAVDDADRATVEEHLADCDTCRAEVAELRETAAALSATTRVEPPAALRGRVMAEIAAVPQVPTDLSARRHSRSDSSSHGPADSPPHGGVDSPSHRRRPTGSGRPWWVGAGAAAAVAVGAVVVWQQPWQQDTTQITAVEHVLQAEDVQRFTEEVAGGTVTVARSQAQGQSVLVAPDLPAPPAGRVYQLWYLDPEGQPHSAGLVPSAAEEPEPVLLHGDANVAQAAAITVEPAGGSEEPTSEPLAVFDFG